MSNINVCRKHEMDATECRAKTEELLGQLVARMGGSYEADGENYVYKHTTGVKAQVEPKAGELNINVKLSLLTRAFGPKLDQEINRQLDKYFA